MPAQKFTIQGRVIDSETRQGLANIEVVTLSVNPAPIGVNATVADTKDNIFRRTTTDEDGNFTLRFTDLDVINYFDGQPSNLFFKLYRDGFLIENTRETQIWDLTDEISNPISRIVIPVTPTGESFVIRRCVVNRDIFCAAF